MYIPSLCKRSGETSRNFKAWPRLLCLVFLGLAFAGCRHDPAAAPDHGHGAALELNDGRKWAVNPAMMVHLRNLESAIQTFDRQPVRDHAALALKIQDHLGQLVTSCTMTGRAHDELHKWLMPVLGLSAEYVQAREASVQEELLGKIKHSLQVFKGYFE